MTDFQKNLWLVIIGGFLTAAATLMANVYVIGGEVASVNEKVISIKESVVKIDTRLEKLEDRQRLAELKQATLLAAN